MLAGRIQIGILAHLPLHFLALFFVVEQNLAVAEMSAFDFSLRFVEERFETGDQPVPRVGFAASIQLGRLLGAEGRFENFVVEREELAVGAGIALPAATSDQLAVDALRLVQLSTNDMQAAQFRHAVALSNVGAAARHVGSHRDFALFTRVTDNFRFRRHVSGIEHFVFDVAFREQVRKDLAFVD